MLLIFQRSRKLCRLWLFVTLATCLFTGFILRIFQMLVVSEYSSELNIEEERAQNPENASRTFQNSVVAHPQIPSQNQPIQLQSLTNRNPPQSSLQNNGPYYYHNHQYYSSSISSTYMVPPTPPSVLPSPNHVDNYEEPPPPYHIAVASCPFVPPPHSCR